MSPTELHALIKEGILDSTGANNTIISSGDEIDIVMGNDYDFDNVESVEFINPSEPKIFDGTNVLDTGIKLFDEDKSFVLAIDYKFSDTSRNTYLASCYEKSSGFTLQYTNKPIVKFGASSNVEIGDGAYREIVVIRKVAGDPNLYVYSSNKTTDDAAESTIINSLSTQNNANLSFGANVQSDGYIDMYAKGTVFWAKLWKSDLGATICHKLAMYPRETITMQAAGRAEHNFRLFRRSDNDRYVNCTFLMKDFLDFSRVFNYGEHGWAGGQLRTWLNSRVYNSLPEQWRMLIQQVKVLNACMGEDELTTTDNYIWVPSCKEVGRDVDNEPFASESEGTINYFTDNNSRIKTYEGVAGDWHLRSPKVLQNNGYNARYVTGSGDIGHEYHNRINAHICFGFCI